MYVALAAIIAFLAGLGVMTFIAFGPLPIVDRGSRIFTVADERTLNSVVRILGQLGLKPRYRIFSSGIKRVVMADNMTIINCTTDEELWRQIGRPAAALALRVKDPEVSAAQAVQVLRAAGFVAGEPRQLDPDIPRNTMCYVRTDAFINTLLVFRKHSVKMGGGIPPRWK